MAFPVAVVRKEKKEQRAMRGYEKVKPFLWMRERVY
jgi:hypothetical protein